MERQVHDLMTKFQSISKPAGLKLAAQGLSPAAGFIKCLIDNAAKIGRNFNISTLQREHVFAPKCPDEVANSKTTFCRARGLGISPFLQPSSSGVSRTTAKPTSP